MRHNFSKADASELIEFFVELLEVQDQIKNDEELKSMWIGVCREILRRETDWSLREYRFQIIDQLIELKGNGIMVLGEVPCEFVNKEKLNNL